MITENKSQSYLQTEQQSKTDRVMNHRMVDLCFRNIRYQIQDQQNNRTILNNISGICLGGQITAILGASGAGKTSLLNVLACRIQNTAKVSLNGDLQANGAVYDFVRFQGFASYVMQNDILLETLTPREVLTFVASFKYNDDQIIQRRVNETLKNMFFINYAL